MSMHQILADVGAMIAAMLERELPQSRSNGRYPTNQRLRRLVDDRVGVGVGDLSESGADYRRMRQQFHAPSGLWRTGC